VFGSRFSGTTRMGYSPASTPFGIYVSRSTSPSATPISCSHRAMTTLWSGRRHVALTSASLSVQFSYPCMR